jgi:hypothetical protein
MDQAILVSFDIEKGQRVIDALDRAGYPPEVAMWAMLPQYENWRFVLSSSKIHGYEELIGHLRKADVLPGERPGVLLYEVDDPFIKELREKYAGKERILGNHLGSQYFGKQYVDEAYVYRIR